MEPETFKHDIARLRFNDWECSWISDSTPMPLEVVNRYSELPLEYLHFISNLEECANSDDTSWILTPSDFDIRLDHAFTHDAWERISIEATDGDEELISQITSFWDNHLPIHFDVADEYVYHAICLKDGSVVRGCEPEFEDSIKVSSNFREFLAQLTK